MDSRPSPNWEDGAALALLAGGGIVAWWGALGSGVLWTVPLVAVAALVAARALGARVALVLAAAWLPGALLVAGVPVAALAPRALGATVATLREGAEVLSGPGQVNPLTHEWSLAAGLLVAGLATLLAALAWRNPRRPLALLGLLLAALPLGVAIAVGRTADASWLGALLLAVFLLRYARGRFLPIATGTAVVVAVALFGSAVAAPRSGWQPFGHGSHPDQFHELSTKQTYGPLEGERTGQVMLDVTAARPALWRMQVLEAFDNLRWRVANEDTDLPEPAARKTSVEVEVRGLDNRQVVSPGRITRIDGVGPTAAEIGSARLLFDKPEDGDTYRVEAETVHVSRARLARVPVPDVRDYLADTQIGLAPIPATIPIPLDRMAKDMPETLVGTDWERLFDLSARLAHGARSELAIVDRVEHYLMDGDRYEYTTDVGPAGVEPVLGFLFHTHRGYCQHYAGAAALLLRVAGIPSRVAVGFATGEQVGAHTWAVRDEDAHAWIEVYFPTVGWVPFNPTPASAQADVAPGIDVLQASAGAVDGPGGTLSGLAGAGAALVLLLVAARLIRRRGPGVGLTDLLLGLAPEPALPRTTLRSLGPDLARIGPATAGLATRAERSRFAPGGEAEPSRPRLAVWRALVADTGPLRGTVMMVRAALAGRSRQR